MMESTPARCTGALVVISFVGTAAEACPERSRRGGPAGRSPAAALPSAEKERQAVANHTTRMPPPTTPRTLREAAKTRRKINVDIRRYPDSTQLPPPTQQTQVIKKVRFPCVSPVSPVVKTFRR